MLLLLASICVYRYAVFIKSTISDSVNIFGNVFHYVFLSFFPFPLETCEPSVSCLFSLLQFSFTPGTNPFLHTVTNLTSPQLSGMPVVLPDLVGLLTVSFFILSKLFYYLYDDKRSYMFI